jgi:hypothetical protein
MAMLCMIFKVHREKGRFEAGKLHLVFIRRRAVGRVPRWYRRSLTGMAPCLALRLSLAVAPRGPVLWPGIHRPLGSVPMWPGCAPDARCEAGVAGLCVGWPDAGAGVADFASAGRRNPTPNGFFSPWTINTSSLHIFLWSLSYVLWLV